MVYVDLYSATVSKVSNTLCTLVRREEPSVQALFEGDIVLLYAEVAGQRVPHHRAMHSKCLAVNSGEPVLRTTISCCVADLRPNLDVFQN